MTKKKGDEIAAPRDPLADLFRRVAKSAAEAYEPATLTALAALKQRDRQAFEEARLRLKAVKGMRIGELDAAIARENGETPRTFTQADVVVQKAEEAEYFRTPDHVAYADVMVDGHRETYPVRSRQYRRWLSRRYYEATGGSAPTNDTMQTALGMIEAKAQINGPVREVHVRVAAHRGMIYVDRCSDKWDAVEISKTGWKVVSAPEVRFRRAPGMLELPVPVDGGSVNSLRRFLNLKNKRDFVLVIHFTLAALRGEGPYPVLALAGEQGSAKSTTTKVIRSLVDPNVASLRSTPREERDLFIGANNAFVLAFDNVSGLQTWISDAICRLSTGGGFSSRQLFTDDEEVTFNLMRPQMVNGIEDMVTRPDLADRSLLLTLDPIPETMRLTESQMWADFEIERPFIMGALFTAAAQGLVALGDVKLARLPRMADFALWSVACETALWPAGTFLRAYEENRAEAVEQIIEASAIASTIRQLMSNRLEWESSPSELLTKLTEIADPQTSKSRGWPKVAHALSGRLRRVASTLRRVGIEIEFAHSHGPRRIHIFQAGRAPQNANGSGVGIPPVPLEVGKTASPASPASQSNGSNGLGATLPDHASVAERREERRGYGDPLDECDAPADGRDASEGEKHDD
jgi:hypothetical protein